MFHIELMFEERKSAIKHIWLDCSFLEIYPHTCLHYGHFAWKNLESKLCSSEPGILKLMFCFLYFYWITLEYFFLLNEWFFLKKWVLVVLLFFFFTWVHVHASFHETYLFFDCHIFHLYCWAYYISIWH